MVVKKPYWWWIEIICKLRANNNEKNNIFFFCILHTKYKPKWISSSIISLVLSKIQSSIHHPWVCEGQYQSAAILISSI